MLVGDREHKFEPQGNLELELGPEPAGDRLREYDGGGDEEGAVEGAEAAPTWRWDG